MKGALELDNTYNLDIAKNIFQTMLRDNDCCNLHSLKINGNDLASEFNLKGADIGNVLNLLLDAVIEDKCQNTKAALLEYFKKATTPK